MSLRQLLAEIAAGWVKAKNEQFTGHPIAALLKQDLIKAIENALPSTANYLIKASAGAGNWADVPWLSILKPSITESTQSGVYPVYLFRADGSGVYLSLGFGTTELKKKYGAALAKQKAEELRNSIRGLDKRLNAWDEKVDLRSNTTLGKSYEWASAGAKFYPLENMPDENVLLSDLTELLEIYADVNLETNQNPRTAVSNAQALSKPFLLLAGISGTGKTRFVREQAKASGSLDETYCLVSVRPDWHEPSDLLGYVSRLGQQPQYIATEVLRFIVRAWKAIIKSIDFDANGKAIDWTGRDLRDIPPYWLCLDEMNLAPVEQYFADYLSILETRYWNDPDVLANSGRDYIYQCDPLLRADVFKDLDSNSGEAHNSEKINVKPSTLLAKDLGLDLTTPLEKDIWAYFLEHGISIPFNLIVAGTVNMDETTHGFSRKVIDRALSFDFGAFFPNDYNDFFTPTSCNKRLCYPIWSNASKADLADTFDADGTKTVAFLSAVNAVLKNTPFELAFRALNELLLAVASSQPQDDLTLKAVWDDFMMCKVLPRIEGDTDKLTTSNRKDLLEELSDVLSDQLAPIWLASETDETNQRPDLYREKIVADGATDEEKVLRIPCRSKAKLQWMSGRLASATFTSFWP
ncbi:MrcB family domain-containing protein [Vibrio diabolicus]|uniref:MrcB family domain-containing protein n=1 Tax=Vibrio diabolicus TaxID=50719 RepID=UPI00374FE52B